MHVWNQAITQTKVGLLSIGLLLTCLSEIWMKWPLFQEDTINYVIHKMSAIFLQASMC